MSLSPPDRTHDISHIGYHVKDLKTFGETLTNAAATAFPNRCRSRYRGVHVLLLSWEDDNLEVNKEVLELQEVFRINYGFEAEEWRIPSQKSHNSLARKLLRLVDDYDDKENLLIVYYGGHGGMDDDRRCIWSCKGEEGSPEVRWFGLQTMLEEAKSDVLILLDCCAAASSTASVDSGITEVIAACGFETWTPGVGEHSFSRSLIDELKFLSTGPLFTAAMLHNKVLSRIKYWKPRYNAGASLNPKDLWTEKRKTPVYILLASEAKQRSIEITPLRPIHSPPLASIAMPAPFPSSASSTSLPGPSLDPDSMDLDSSQSSLNSVWPDTSFKCPKVLITVALEEEQWLQTGSFLEWLKAVPALAKFAHVEGVYHSDSTLLIVSIPVAVWDLLPKTPALGFIGFVRSYNVLSQNMPDLSSNTATVLIPTGDAVPEQVTGQFGELFKRTSIRRSPPVEFDQGMAGENIRSPASSSKAGLSAPVSTVQGSLQRSQTSPTQEPKTHMASVCVNCKRKHLKCDQNRPCLRCVQIGKEDSCVDMQYKKRGRPSLRPGDSPSNTFSSGLSRSQQSLISSYLSPSEDPAFRGQKTSLRPIRPGTGTQSPGSGDTRQAPRFPQPYPWQSSPSSTAVTVSPPYSFISAPTRPFSAAPSVPDPSYYLPSYGPPSAGFAPIDVPRSYPQQTSYFPQTQAFQFSQFSTPQFLYGEGYQPTTRSLTRPIIGEPVARETLRYSLAYPGPQLPPLQPGAAEQAQRQAQQLRPEQFHDIPQTRQHQGQHPPNRTSKPEIRQREGEEKGDQGEPASKRRRMKIGEILER